MLGPILFQDEKVRDLNRRSRRVPDIDPESGEEEGALFDAVLDEPVAPPSDTMGLEDSTDE